MKKASGKKKNGNNLETMRHSCAHVLAAAIKKIYGPSVKFAIGPTIENGFYYDFDFAKKIQIGEADFAKIEKEMGKIVQAQVEFIRWEQPISEALKKEKRAKALYKTGLIEDLKKEGAKKVSYYALGGRGPKSIFTDLCAGPHLENAAKIGSFKLLSVAGAYWRGDEKNKMLTRIYGTCFKNQKQLDNYLWQQEETKKRDHKKLAKELDIFSFHEEGLGFVFWHPNGMRMRQPLTSFWQEEHAKAGYEEVSTPILLSTNLWKQSGHWRNYKDKMYFVKKEGKTFALKPMNCPGSILIYKTRPHSYRELPIRWRELGLVHRFEPSGTLNGLLRERAFRQDDAHIFCQESQMENELKGVIKLALKIYKAFKFDKDIRIELSTRPKKSIGTDRMWSKAEKTLKKVLKQLAIDYEISEGEGAFYGPKIDFHLTDSLNRHWQCGTIQLDFAMPERFDLTYIDEKGRKRRPVMIHRTVFGSVHRFFGILIEHYGGKFPLWLSPCQVKILPVSDQYLEYGRKIHLQLIHEGVRAELDGKKETLQAKIREATLQKVPYMIIVGDREAKSGKISLRVRDGKDLGQMELTKFVRKAKLEIERKE